MDSNFINNWLTSHSQVASQLGKPLILEEVCLGDSFLNILST